MKKILLCLFQFITDQKFQEKQKWVERLAKKLSCIHQHIWTLIRAPGGFITVAVTRHKPIFGLIVFLLFSLTDWVDGKVVWIKGAKNSKFGAILDGGVDKCFVLPVLWIWGRVFSPDWVFGLLTTIEFGGYIFLLPILDILDFISPDRRKNIFEHLLVGKIKLGLQVFLGFLLWIARFYREWPMWPVIVNVNLILIIVLAVFSVGCKINPAFGKYIIPFFNYIAGKLGHIDK